MVSKWKLAELLLTQCNSPLHIKPARSGTFRVQSAASIWRQLSTVVFVFCHFPRPLPGPPMVAFYREFSANVRTPDLTVAIFLIIKDRGHSRAARSVSLVIQGAVRVA